MKSHTKTTRSTRPKKRFVRNSARRRLARGLIRLTALLVVLGVAGFIGWESLNSLDNTSAPSEGLDPDRERPSLEESPSATPISAPDPPDLTLASFAYRSIEGELPDVSPEDVEYTQKSVLDPSWAVVLFPAPANPENPEKDRSYAVFLEESGDEWTASESVIVEDQDFPKNVTTLLTRVPKDLVNPLFPKDDPPEPETDPEKRAVQVVAAATEMRGDWESSESLDEGDFHRVRVENKSDDEDLATDVYLRGREFGLQVAGIGDGLTSAEVPGFPARLAEPAFAAAPVTVRSDPATAVYEGESEGDARVEKGVGEAQKEIQSYPGVAGFYAIDLQSDSGYGVRPDEEFFSASTIKVPVMAAVYRRIDAGEMEYGDSFETTEEDFAAGAGWLQWETPGARSTVEDALWLMMTQSDNVATNALIRLAGGPEYVNEVARDLGAKDTQIVRKVSSERAAVPSLDNHTTPRDMAVMVRSIRDGEGASEYASGEMVGLMEQNNLEFWIEAGLPQNMKAANKGGWLDASYNDVALVEYGERPYIVAVFTKYGQDMPEGERLLADLSEAVFLAQSGETKQEFEKKAEDRESEGQRSEGREESDEKPGGSAEEKGPESPPSSPPEREPAGDS